MEYEVSAIATGITLIEERRSGFRVQAGEQTVDNVLANSAYMLTTLYAVRGGFVQDKTFVFQIVNMNNSVLDETDLDELKKVIDFFFVSILGTELYIKEVPLDSALFALESSRLFGSKPVSYLTRDLIPSENQWRKT